MPQSERRKRRIVANCFFRLTQLLKNVLTGVVWKRFGVVTTQKNFFCDGHPWLCVSCIRLRYGLIYGKLPFALEIICARGSFIWWESDRVWNRPETYKWLEGILTRRIKERYRRGTDEV